MKWFLVALVFVHVWCGSLSVAASARQKINLNQDWHYHKGDIEPIPVGRRLSTDNWQVVSLPHTYQLTSINLDDSADDKFQLTFHRDVSWYRKRIKVSAKPGNKVYLEFEGAYQKTDLWVNGRHVGQHAVSAYTPFHFDITPYTRLNRDNIITVRLDNRKDPDIPPDGHSRDYVLFGGLYRDVYLVVKDQLQIGFPWESRAAGVFVTTPSVSEKNATVSIRTQVKNLSKKIKKFTLITRVLDADNQVVLKLKKQASLKPDSAVTLLQAGGIDENVRLWSIDDPYLYRVNSRVVADGVVADSVDNPLGLRWLEHRLGQGVLLNGKPIKLIGANRHQHYPYIGDAVPNNLHRSDAIKFKQSGMNIVRLAHYPHDNAFVEACDELGILIAEEPPTWIEFGTPIWMDRLEESMRRMIRNHRNHPSIWGWGAGINHRGPVKRLHYAAKEEDPTRVTMNNGTLWTGPQHSGVTDIYAVMDYRGAKRPEGELLFAMEHTSTPDTLLLQTMVSRYKGDPNLIGLASWSAHESNSFIKRGEQYPNLSRWEAASWDSFRAPKPTFYWYQSELTETAMVHIADSRAQTAGSVNIFTNTDEVELFHNGRSLGKKTPAYTDANRHLNSPSIFYPFDWQAGELSVKGYRGGKLVAEHKRVKGGVPEKLQLVWDLDGFDYRADGSSIVLGFARLLDSRGNLIDDLTAKVRFDIAGPAEIVGDASIGANPVISEHGLAPVLIRMGKQPGEITLTATAEGLGADSIRLVTRPWSVNQPPRPTFEPLRLKVDVGNSQQHIEDEWEAFSVDRGAAASSSFTLDNGKNVRVEISAAEGDLTWGNTWGVPGDLSFMIEDGVSATGKILLSFNQLPAGRYRLKTWHHILSGEIEQAPTLSFFSVKSQIPLLSDYQPTFGRQIQVSVEGGGDGGDGGSNKGAAGYALHDIDIDDSGSFTLAIASHAGPGPVKLTGFDLQQIITE